MFTKSKFKIQVIETIIMTSDLTSVLFFYSIFSVLLREHGVLSENQKNANMETVNMKQHVKEVRIIRCQQKFFSSDQSKRNGE
jgi:nucleoside permease NupC